MRLTTVCHLWPSISPHGAEVPTSIWNVPYGVWLSLAEEVDQFWKTPGKTPFFGLFAYQQK